MNKAAVNICVQAFGSTRFYFSRVDASVAQEVQVYFHGKLSGCCSKWLQPSKSQRQCAGFAPRSLVLSGGPSDREAKAPAPVYTGRIPKSECVSESPRESVKKHRAEDSIPHGGGLGWGLGTGICNEHPEGLGAGESENVI